MRYRHALPEGWEGMSYADSIQERRKRITRVIRDGFKVLCEA
jgi:hypothetical protein